MQIPFLNFSEKKVGEKRLTYVGTEVVTFQGKLYLTEVMKMTVFLWLAGFCVLRFSSAFLYQYV